MESPPDQKRAEPGSCGGCGTPGALSGLRCVVDEDDSAAHMTRRCRLLHHCTGPHHRCMMLSSLEVTVVGVHERVDRAASARRCLGRARPYGRTATGPQGRKDGVGVPRGLRRLR